MAKPQVFRHRSKKAFDVVGAALGLIALSPVMLIVSMLVAVMLGRPILFRQLRPGLNRKPFVLLKFRTMRHQSEGLQDRDRLTGFGRVLRSSSLDELPELWNVLRGEMSLVGPRPLLMEYLPLYSPEQQRRHEVRPGITGWAQVNGRNEVAWPERLRMDVWYVDNWSMSLDLRILATTIHRVLQRSGVSQSGHVTMAPFRGER